jgi:TM2 domain-containing membrane protein YozV
MSNYCKKCGKELQEGSKFCAACGQEVSTGIHCTSCNAELDDNTAFCKYCGTQTHVEKNREEERYSFNQNATAIVGSKSKVLSIVLALFLGCFGVHNFYLGYTTRGIAQLVASIISLFFTGGFGNLIIGIWVLVEVVLIATDKVETAANGAPIK